MGQLSKERLIKFKSVSHKYFDWMTVLTEGGVTDIQDLDDQLLLKCFLHPDKRPSFRVRLNNHDCHCFSCGYWGTVVDVMYELSGKITRPSDFFEQVLKRTPGMQNELGFNSLFIDERSLDPGFNSRRTFSAANHIGATMPLSVLYSKVKSLGATWENLVFSLTLLQEGASPEDIIAKLSKTAMPSKTKVSEEVSLLSLFDE